MSVERPLIDDIRIVGTRFATLTRDAAPFGIYNVPSDPRTVLFVVTEVLFNRIGAAAMALPVNATAALVDARFTRAPVVAVRDDVALRDVVVRATVAPPDAPVRVDVAVRPAPPVARVAAARVAASVAVRVAVVDVVRDAVPRDATAREFEFERGEVFVVVRAATAREEFAADARPDAAPALDVGTVRPIVVRFAFVRAPDTPRDVDTEGIVTVSSGSRAKSVSS